MKTKNKSELKMKHPKEQFQQVYKVRCLDCGHKFSGKVIEWICPKCDSLAIVIYQSIMVEHYVIYSEYTRIGKKIVSTVNYRG